MKKIITVFGSSRPRPGDVDYETAYRVGEAIAHAGFVVCNGGYAGTMAASSKGAKDAGGSTIGVTFSALGNRPPNPHIDHREQEDTLIARMMRLIELGSGYVVLKGGTGTLLELAAVWEHVNKGLLPQRPIILVGRFWEGVVRTLQDELTWEGTDRCTAQITFVDTPEACGKYLRSVLQD